RVRRGSPTSRRLASRGWRGRPSMQPCRAPADLDLKPEDLITRLLDALQEVSSPGRGREHGHHLPEPVQLPEQQLAITPRRLRSARREPAKLGFPVECM